MRDINLINYRQITAQERINLTVLALARNDIKEADRLYDSCPKYDYKVIDKEYNCRLMAIPIINHLFLEQCVYHYNILAKIDSTILLLEATILACLNEENEARFDRLYHSHELHIGKLKALYLGFREFCYQIGIDAEGALKTIGVEGCCFDINQYVSSNIEPDLESIEESKLMFFEYWGF